MICSCCGDDIDKKGQDNMSEVPDQPMCEDCYDVLHVIEKQKEESE